MATVEPLALERLPRVSGARGLRAAPPWAWAGARERVVCCDLARVGHAQLVVGRLRRRRRQSSEQTVGREVPPGRRRRPRRDRRGRSLAGARRRRRDGGIAGRRSRCGGSVPSSGACSAVTWRRCSRAGARRSRSISGSTGAPTETRVADRRSRLRAEVAGVAGTVRIHAPAEWLSLGPARSALVGGRESRSARGTPLHGRRRPSSPSPRCGSRSSQRAGVGDAVVFDGTGGRPPPNAPVALRIGDHAAPARANGAGGVVLAGRFQAAERRLRATGAP